MKKIIQISSLILLIVFVLFISISNLISDNNIKKIDKLDLDDVNNIMIVAHPDDETLWGGDHLSKSNYLVVCVTCGVDKQRQEEFNNVVNEYGNVGLSLGFPDKTNGQKDNWSKHYYIIEKTLKKIINYKDWDMIVTHNPDGEYGHIHHQMISTMVTKNAKKDNLYYFNKYYTKEELENINNCKKELNEKELKMKNHLLSYYSSQEAIINNHYQNVPLENFIPYKYWN